jgi:signal transduction histidine kinase
MKLATRITLITAGLAVVALGALSLLVLRELSSDIRDVVENETQAVAQGTAASLLVAGADQSVVGWLTSHAPPGIRLAVLPLSTDAALPAGWSNDDVDRLDLVRRSTLTGQPTSAEIAPGGTPVIACAVPVKDASGNVALVVEAEHDEAEIAADESAARWRVLGSFVLVVAVLALVVYRVIRRTVETPLTKLLAGVTDVARGDLAAALLSERGDEIGGLAVRFNEMTASLREAREETRRGVAAQLALEQRLRHSEKLATIGQVAAEIAHEVGTPLNVIGGRTRAMARKAERPEEVQKNAGIIAEQADRITRIIQRLLDFARRRAPARGDVDVVKAARDTLDFLAHTIEGGHIAARLTQGRAGDGTVGGALSIPGDRDQVQQVVLNLVMNAIQAMPGGGALTVDVSRVVRKRQGLDLAAPAPYVALSVSDTGVGIPAADREHIFEPFFSTKADGQGTGLGLAVSHGIVKDHDGWIEIDSPLAGGTTFRVFLPVEAVAGADPEKPGDQKPGDQKPGDQHAAAEGAA